MGLFSQCKLGRFSAKQFYSSSNAAHSSPLSGPSPTATGFAESKVKLSASGLGIATIVTFAGVSNNIFSTNIFSVLCTRTHFLASSAAMCTNCTRIASKKMRIIKSSQFC